MSEAFDSRTGKYRTVYATRQIPGSRRTQKYFSEEEYWNARRSLLGSNAAQRNRINNAVGGRVV